MNRFRVITSDPPWMFREAWGNGAAAHHYRCLSPEQLMALPVGELALSDSALFLWTTDPQLDVALEVMRAWGFTFKTVAFYYVKTNKGGGYWMGCGYYLRGNPELCLLGVRGSMTKYRQAKDVRKLIVRERLRHSEKPPEAYERIERLYPGPYLDVFARQQRPAWVSIGDEIDGLDIADSIARLLALPAPEFTEGVA